MPFLRFPCLVSCHRRPCRYLTSNIGHWATIRAHELKASYAKGRKDGATMPPGVAAEIASLLDRGPSVDHMLTDALKSPIILKPAS